MSPVHVTESNASLETEVGHHTLQTIPGEDRPELVELVEAWRIVRVSQLSLATWLDLVDSQAADMMLTKKPEIKNMMIIKMNKMNNQNNLRHKHDTSSSHLSMT